MSGDGARRAAVVTGGSRGIGRATAERLAAEGHDVAIVYREREEAAAEVVDAIAAAGGRGIAIKADLEQGPEVKRAIQEAHEGLGRLDALVLCAAAIPAGPVLELSEEDFDWAFTVNVRANYLAVRAAAPLLADGGRIVAISSLVTLHIQPIMHAYAASKAALEVLIRQIAGELGPRGITANLVVPGPTNTDGLVLPPGAGEALLAMTPLGRFAEPDDIASVIAFLVSDEARWITGQRLYATGGLT
jgi:3-oxoacyl-[acyl-carrier protein] reductase